MLSTRSIPALLAFVAMLACSPKRDESTITQESASGAAADTLANADEDRPDPSAVAAIAVLRELADRDEALIEMARLAVTRREQLGVSADARRILSDGRRESNRLLGMLKSDYRVNHTPAILPEDQTLIDSLNGVGVGGFDRTFLGIVAKHHEDDARVIEDGLARITQPRIREALSQIRQQRTSEAAALRQRAASAPSTR